MPKQQAASPQPELPELVPEPLVPEPLVPEPLVRMQFSGLRKVPRRRPDPRACSGRPAPVGQAGRQDVLAEE